MNKIRLFAWVVAGLFALNQLSAQIYLTVKAVPGQADTWGVYARTCDNVMPSGNTITGSGQITVIYPLGKTLSNVTNVAGLWTQNAMVTGPAEAPNKVYVSFGFLNDIPQIIYQPDTETLLFTFKLTGGPTGSPSLIVNGVDPFDHLPNSANSNPGNELTVIDFGTFPLSIYNYVGNYTGTPPDCTPGPIDTTVIDTTVVTPPDTTGTDTTVVTPPDTTGTDTTTVTPPDSTATSGARNLLDDHAYFTLYPTPAFDWITVKFFGSTPAEGKVKLFNTSGIAIGMIEKGQDSELKINVSGLPSGIYYLSFEREGDTLQRERFLKQ